MRRSALAWISAAVLTLSLVLLAPLAVVVRAAGVEQLGLSAPAAEGTAWSGRLREARLHHLPLGDVEVRLAPWPLLTGAVRLELAASDGAVTGTAALVRRPGGDGLVELDGAAPLSLFDSGLPLKGLLRFEGVELNFAAGRCASARGRVAAEPADAGGIVAGAPRLQGEAACEGGELVLPLRGTSDQGAVALTLRLDPDGDYRLETLVADAGPELGSALRLAGFVETGTGQLRTDQGRLRR